MTIIQVLFPRPPALRSIARRVIGSAAIDDSDELPRARRKRDRRKANAAVKKSKAKRPAYYRRQHRYKMRGLRMGFRGAQAVVEGRRAYLLAQRRRRYRLSRQRVPLAMPFLMAA